MTACIRKAGIWALIHSTSEHTAVKRLSLRAPRPEMPPTSLSGLVPHGAKSVCNSPGFTGILGFLAEEKQAGRGEGRESPAHFYNIICKCCANKMQMNTERSSGPSKGDANLLLISTPVAGTAEASRELPWGAGSRGHTEPGTLWSVLDLTVGLPA